MTAPDDVFSAHELEVWSALATLLERLPAALDAQLQADAGISHFEFGILFALSRVEGHTLRMSELAGFANGTLSRLSRAVARLERKGWVVRAVDAADRRVTTATLTADGLAAQRAAEPGHVELVRRLVFAQLSSADADQLLAAARTISAAIDPRPQWDPADRQR